MPRSPKTKTRRPTRSGAPTVELHGALSWTLSSNLVDLAITEEAGHLAPVHFRLGKQLVQPFHIAPWAEELRGTKNHPPILKVLRGDFFCMPFGGNATAWKGENHPAHGETANRKWTRVSREQTADFSQLRMRMRTKIRKGTVTKEISLRRDEPVVYCRHILEGMSGPMNLGHHAMLRFPEEPGSGLLSFSKPVFAQVYPGELESATQGGYSILQPGAHFRTLKKVPRRDGRFADLSSYPAREGYEDLVMLSADPKSSFAWSAVSFPGQGYVWFALKDPRVLASTILWHSNGGRHYEPWNGRHRGVLGIEEVTSWFHEGLAESTRKNDCNALGIPTVLDLSPDKPLRVDVVMGCAAIPSSFGRVASIRKIPGGMRIQSAARGQQPVEVPVLTDFLSGADPAAVTD